MTAACLGSSDQSDCGCGGANVNVNSHPAADGDTDASTCCQCWICWSDEEWWWRRRSKGPTDQAERRMISWRKLDGVTSIN